MYAQTLTLVNLIVVKLGMFENSFLTFVGCPVERFGRELKKSSRNVPEPPYLPQNLRFVQENQQIAREHFRQKY